MNTITDIEGVFASGAHCGIKQTGASDLAYLYVPGCTGSGAVFTQNHFAAPSVVLTRKHLQAGVLKACVINSGNANAGTGASGMRDTRQIAEAAAELLKMEPEEVAVASTGCIGKPMPMEKIMIGLRELLAEPEVRNGAAAARAIMTTDTRPKHVFFEAAVGSHTVQVAGMAKGSGMIAPNMATMLAFLVTNVALSSSELQMMLTAAVDDSFNMLSVDTDTSTNDMVLAFASGAAPNTDETKQAASELLLRACQDLAKLIAADGEGATRLIEVRVRGAARREDARGIARSVVESPLVKTAVHGGDPNWGRILAAAGKQIQCRFDPEKVSLWMQGRGIMLHGELTGCERRELSELLQRGDVLIVLDLNLGQFEATAWGCDLSARYVEINTEYS